MPTQPATIMAALDAQTIVWAVVVLIVTTGVTVSVTAWREGRRESASAKQAADKRNESLADQLARERHEQVMGGMKDLKGDMHDVRASLDMLKPRVDRLEVAVFPPKGDRS